MARILVARVITAFALLLVASSAHAQLAPSQWKNQRGSTMSILFVNPITGFLSGYYINNAPGFPRCAGTPYTLFGRTNGQAITFQVYWVNAYENCNSTTVWTGKVVGNKIDTKWVLTYPGGQRTGQDSFSRQ